MTRTGTGGSKNAEPREPYFSLLGVYFVTFCCLFVVQVVELFKILLGKLKFDTGISLTGILHSLGPVMSIKLAKI